MPVWVRRVDGSFYEFHHSRPRIEITCEVEGGRGDLSAAYRMLEGLGGRSVMLGGVDPVERDARWTAALAKALGGNTKAIEAVLAAFNASGAA